MTIPVDFNLVAGEYNAADRRLILLDYDGTLVPFANDPRLARPDARLIAILTKLASEKCNDVVVISGRTRQDLEDFFGDVGITLVAEHGGFYKPPFGEWCRSFNISPDWISPVAKAIKALTFQHEGTHLEEKHYSVAWHYRPVMDRLTGRELNEIVDALRRLPDHGKFIIDDSQYTIELRTPLIEKGMFLDWWCREEYSFKIAFGDGRTDEDLFRTLRGRAFRVRIGESETSAAAFHLTCQADVLPFLTKLLLVNEEFERMKQDIGLDQEDFSAI